MFGSFAFRNTLRHGSLSYRSALNVCRRTVMLQAGKDFINGVRGKPTTFKSTSSLFTNCKLQGYHPDWYSKGLVEKNFDTRSYLLLLHMWMLHHKLLRCGDFAEVIDEALFAMMWEDVENWVRGAPGVEEMYVNKFLQQMTKAGLIFCIELDDALKYEPDEKEVLLRIGDVLWRYLYNEAKDKDAQIEVLAKYARNELHSVLDLPDEAVVDGRIHFGSMPHFPRDHLTPEQMEEEDDRTIRGYLYGHWYEDRTLTGKPYFWNNASFERRWEVPKPEEEVQIFDLEFFTDEEGNEKLLRTRRLEGIENGNDGSYKTTA